MNPLTNVKNITKLNEIELKRGLTNKSSWHNIYKDSAWIFIGGLAYGITEGDVITVFSQYGEIVNINMVRDKKTGKTRGFCFLCYANQKSTVLAVDNFNGIKICNRTIRVDHVADYKPPKEHEDTDDLTKMLYAEGCAPKPLKRSNSSDDEITEIPIKLKKPKKEKKKKKKKRKHNESDSSDGEKTHKHDHKKKSKRDSLPNAISDTSNRKTSSKSDSDLNFSEEKHVKHHKSASQISEINLNRHSKHASSREKNNNFDGHSSYHNHQRNNEKHPKEFYSTSSDNNKRRLESEQSCSYSNDRKPYEKYHDDYSKKRFHDYDKKQSNDKQICYDKKRDKNR